MELTKKYEQELAQAEEMIEKDKRLTPLQKEKLKITIYSNKMGGYSIGEYGENHRLYDKLSDELYEEFVTDANQYFNRFEWFLFKKTYNHDIGITVNLILANWFSIMEDNMKLINVVEDDKTIEETYLLEKNYLTTQDNVGELLNLNKQEYLNIIYSIWLTEEQIINILKFGFKKLSEKKYMKVSSKSEIYHENGQWYKKSTNEKHRWRKSYVEFLEENEMKRNEQID